ncbi:MAG: type IV pili twitching motility protein PilT, partial [Pseudomonadota bacterium]
IAQGRDPYGMMSFDQSLIELVHGQLVTYEEALLHSTNPDDFALAFRGISGGVAEDWQQEQMMHAQQQQQHQQGPGGQGNARGRPRQPTKPAGGQGPGFDIDRFGKE